MKNNISYKKIDRISKLPNTEIRYELVLSEDAEGKVATVKVISHYILNGYLYYLSKSKWVRVKADSWVAKMKLSQSSTDLNSISLSLTVTSKINRVYEQN